ncbi:RagB/SusD family nutrient uptake outer membrane protein [Pedobacter sp. MC2016-14]|uniref:RagB/SusD family nutrient uptake outer membrane protein n=1 Tax=Pedobacter sp. MC2016-14 TaxID=2897327 RepID=UPI001E5DE3A7|nr:RagB/SusD family nutrient uptake outer membrane protein [Pedobacter sp. MC2016-14]MCD0487490.1 RagB/SusD family nutrient uptake outer membrane protein [Pedobacter sp. MC2016-14]
MKTKNFLMLLAGILFLSACTKFLDTEPLSSNVPENFYNTEKQMMSALAGVYDRIGRSQTYGDQMLGRMALDADEAFFGRTSTVEGVAINKASASDINVANNWTFWYDGINRANYLLQNIKKPQMDSVARNAVEGEALFLRAYYYFMLVKHWGDVPLILTPVESATDTYSPRVPAKQVYEQILADMKRAEGLVKTAKQVGFGGRVNKSAVRGILARVCLHMAGQPINDVTKYQEARDWALKVMKPDPEDGFQHSLNPSYQNVFINYCQDKYDINESIWEIEFQGNATDSYQETGRVGSNNGIAYSGTDPNYGYSYAYVYTTARLWYMFDNPTALLSADERRDWSIAPYTTAGTPVIETAIPIANIYQRSSGKWRRELELVNPKTTNWGPINFPLLRYSDVLLMFAEADYKVNGNTPTTAAIDAVNQVRRRAYGKDLPNESVRMVQVTTAGTGYKTAPTVVISDGGGTGATAKAFISAAGVVTRVKVLTEGTGYTTAPTVTFVGGSPTTTAVATSLISTRRTSTYLLTSTQIDNFQITIEEERSRELCFESLRKGDLIRWGKYLSNMDRVAKDFAGLNAPGIPAPNAANERNGAAYFTNVSAKDLLWPLSPKEMSLNTGLRPQNPGY